MRLGSHHTLGAKKKLSEARKGKYTSYQNKIYYDPEILTRLYIDEKKNSKQIAATFGLKSPTTIINALVKNNIPRRDPGEVTALNETSAVREKQRQAHLGERNYNWQGGRRLSGGYVRIVCRQHPWADKEGTVPEHRLIAERVLGRFLRRSEVVHHINGIKADNRNENLLICEEKYHLALHLKMRRRSAQREKSG